MTPWNTEKIEAFFAVSAHDFVPSDGFSVHKSSLFSPLRLVFETVEAPLLSYLEKTLKGDPSLRVLCAKELPVTAERRSYTLYRLEHLTAPEAAGRMVRAEKGHREALAELFSQMFLATEGAPLPPDLGAAFADGDRTDTYLWETGGRPAAMARVAHRGNAYARLNTVVTHAEHRGRGYAAMLVGHLAARLLDEGLVPTVLADSENPVANRLYTRLGFIPTGTLYEYRFSTDDTPRESALTVGCFGK